MYEVKPFETANNHSLSNKDFPEREIEEQNLSVLHQRSPILIDRSHNQERSRSSPLSDRRLRTVRVRLRYKAFTLERRGHVSSARLEIL